MASPQALRLHNEQQPADESDTPPLGWRMHLLIGKPEPTPPPPPPRSIKSKASVEEGGSCSAVARAAGGASVSSTDAGAPDAESDERRKVPCELRSRMSRRGAGVPSRLVYAAAVARTRPVALRVRARDPTS